MVCQRLCCLRAGICENADCAIPFKYTFTVLLFESTFVIRDTQSQDDGLLIDGKKRDLMFGSVEQHPVTTLQISVNKCFEGGEGKA